MGKCTPVTRILPASFAWMLLLSATGVFFVFPCRYLMSVYSIGIPILQGVITFFVVINFALATFINPGVVPKAKPGEAKNDGLVSPTYKEIQIRGINVRLKWCVTCQFYRPPRCVHCGICDMCIETFDHHCPWVNNCIGRRNYRYFFMFLLWLSIHMISILSLCCFYMKDHLKDIKQLQTIMTIGIVAVIVVLAIPILGLTAYHMLLIMQGKTTNEKVTGKFLDVRNPYDKGCCKNIMQSLCNSPIPKFKSERIVHYPPTRYASRNSIIEQPIKENFSSNALKASAQLFNYSDKPNYMLSRKSLPAECEDTSPTYLNRGHLHLSLSESLYNRPEPVQKNRGSRALTPPVPIRFDCSRRSLPPHNKLHVPSPHYVVAQSVHGPVVTKDTSKMSACTSSQPTNSTLYYTQYQDPSVVKYSYTTSNTDICGPPPNFYSQLYKRKDVFIKPDVANGNTQDGKGLQSDTCCLGNQTVDKLQEIANRTMIGGQCADVSEAFPKGCSSFHNSPNKEHLDSHQLLIAQTPQQLYVNNCVDCQQMPSNHPCQRSISGEFARTPGNRPLSFVKAMEMSEALNWKEDNLQCSVPESVTHAFHIPAEHPSKFSTLSPISPVAVSEHKSNKGDHEVSYEISV